MDAIDIVLLTYNRLEYLVATVEALRERTPEPFRLTIVDNASESSVRNWLAEHRHFFHQVIFQAQNLFSCVGGTTTPPALGISSANPATYTEGRECGFGKQHQEMINAPKLGPIVLLGLRLDGGQ